MKFNLEKIGNNHLYPEILSYLDKIPDNFLFHNNYSLRHPYSNLQFSLTKIFDNLEILLRELKEFNINAASLGHKIPDSIIFTTKDLLIDLNSFSDDCFLIIMTLTPPTNEKFRTITEWISKTKTRSALEFRSETTVQADYWKEQINALKHSNTKLKYITGYIGEIVIPGYYIEGADKIGAIGPIEKIHPKFRGKTTAYSYNFHIKKNILYIYYIMNKLQKHLLRHFKEIYKHKLTKSKEYNMKTDKIKTVISQASNLPNIFFPDESAKKTTDIYIDDSKFTLNYPGTSKYFGYKSMQFSMLLLVEKYNNGFYLPYALDPETKN